jgi:hypothetical protein
LPSGLGSAATEPAAMLHESFVAFRP